jgi:flagellar basal body-associated protein FliL
MNETPVTSLPEEPKKNNTTIIIAVVVGVVLCCCCAVAVGFWFGGDQLISMFQ